ncbi:serine O-acetyltransferase [Variovorax sp.]|uniref:serine O-acetyltransferase n=1 Tax=Variovorax sp. TaxID=1871043 RepID=UPI002D41663F|nr:serine O-acetyltransferase [Variovorax sp.]HYP83965.1 serine O-acetyltransferase [Variovorax sp.]
MFQRLRSDIRCILERDPAARSAWDVLTLYPGLHAVMLHRPAHWCWQHGLRWAAGFIARFSRWFTGIEIHPAAKVGNGVFFDHAMGVVVGETAEIGDGCTIYQGVTLGGTSLYKGTKRHPTLGRNVVVGAGAKVLGGFTVGDGARIGSNAVVTRPVPAGATAVGIPARIVPGAGTGEAPAQGAGAFAAYGVTQGDDPLSLAMRSLIDSASSQDHQITLLWQAIEKLAQERERGSGDCVPGDAARQACFEAAKVAELVGK